MTLLLFPLIPRHRPPPRLYCYGARANEVALSLVEAGDDVGSSRDGVFGAGVLKGSGLG